MPTQTQPPSVINVFNKDVESNTGYLYTRSSKLSCKLSTDKIKSVVMEIADFKNKSLLDMACGDGFYTIYYWDQIHPKAVTGFDLADQAIAQANEAKGNRPIHFEVGNAEQLQYPDNSFDIVLIQGILHHLNYPFKAIQEAFRVAPEIVILEPNGNNPGLKMVEKLSPYHREHQEKSYSSRQLRQWIHEAGGQIIEDRVAGLVPHFSPDWFARLSKALEPVVENTPVLNAVGSAYYVIHAKRS